MTMPFDCISRDMPLFVPKPVLALNSIIYGMVALLFDQQLARSMK